jgi:flagellar hook-associated protein FlgK
MSANTSSLLEQISELDRAINEARAAGSPTTELEASKQALVRKLNEANVALGGRELLKG